MRYRISVTELIPSPTPTAAEDVTPGETIFQQVVEFKPNVAKLVASLTPSRIRKPRSKTA